MTVDGRAAVLGSPIEHSLSPVLHLAAYRALGLNWDYGRFEVTREELAGFVAELDDLWRGLSLTMPLKEEALACAARSDEVALLTQSANTLVRSPEGEWCAFNTDVFGIVESIRHAAPERRCEEALILGAGATARSAIVALRDLGVGQVTVAARRPEAARGIAELAEECGITCVPVDIVPVVYEVGLVVSTLPADAAAPWARVAPGFGDAVLLDVTYAPWPTTLARSWHGPVARGADLLLWQATEQVRLMTGREAPVGAMREALEGYPQS